MSSGGHERDYDDVTKDSGFSKTYDRGGGRTDKEFWGQHGTHHTETTYRDGTIYRQEDDGTTWKRK